MLAEAFTTCACALVLIIAYLLYFRIQQDKSRAATGFPPGPQILPIFGNISFIGSSPVESVQKWKRKYGNIFGINFGERQIVVISGHSLIKEAYTDTVFCGRVGQKCGEVTGAKDAGLLHSESSTWTEQRRFVVKNLRDFGFGKRTMESMTHEDIGELIANLKESIGKSINPSRSFSMAVLNSLWHIMAGERFCLDDSRFDEVLDSLKEAITATSVGGGAFAFPGFEGLMPRASDWSWSKKSEKAIPFVQRLVQSRIEEHKKTFNPEDLRDFMDVYLQEINDTTDSASSFYKETGERNMLVSILNIFGGGSETTSATLTWALYFLSKDLLIQKKFQDEIDQIVGHFRMSTLNDKLEMPFTEAIVLETLRMSSIMPFGIPHAAMKDISFHGFQIPKDSVILANLFDIHHDEKIWGDPEVFRPERFLTKDGRAIDKSHPPVVAFSIGKRKCLGESLASDNVFLFLTSLFQRFNITADPSNKAFKVKATSGGLFRTAPDFKVIMQDRLEFLDRNEPH